MAVEAFGQEDFNVKAWLNDALAAPDQPLDAQAAQLLLRLQLQLGEASRGLEEVGRQAMAHVPRVLRDIETVRYDATTLRERLDAVREDIERVERETGSSIASLSAVDTVKERLCAAAAGVQHAHDWDSMVEALDQPWQDSDLAQVAERLGRMRQALEALAGLPDYDSRRRQLQAYETKLEGLMAPALVDAFSNQNYEVAGRLQQHFCSIGREGSLYDYYYSGHRAPALAAWASLHAQHLVGTGPMCNIEALIGRLHEQLLGLAQKEATWLQHVFNNAATVLATLLARILTALAPSPADCLAHHIKTSPSGSALKGLQLLQRLMAQTAEWALALHAVIGPLGEPDGAARQALVCGIYQAYGRYLRAYGDTETQALLDSLKASVHLVPVSYLDSIGHIAESVPVAFGLLDQARARCLATTNGLAAMGFLAAADALVEGYVQQVMGLVSALRGMCDLDSSKKPTEDMDFASQDWSQFQGALMLLQAVGDMMGRLQRTDTWVRSALLDAAAQALGSSNRDLTQPFNCLADTPADAESLALRIATIRSGGEVLSGARRAVQTLNNAAHRLAFDIMFAHIDRLLATVPSLPAWASSGGMGTGLVQNLKSFSLTQQPYVTQIGQHLLTLPQQLELFVAAEDGEAANANLHTALERGTLPFASDLPADPQAAREGQDIEQAHRWLEAVAHGTMKTYVGRILAIPALTQHGTRQLAKDIEYLCNVLNVLDIEPSKDLAHMRTLASAPLNELKSMAAGPASDSLGRMTERMAAIRKA